MCHSGSCCSLTVLRFSMERICVLMATMWVSFLSSKNQRSSKAGGVKKNLEEDRRKLPKLRNPAKLWQNRRQQKNITTAEDELHCEEALQQEKKEQLEEVSSRLIIREEELFSQDSPSEKEEDQLQRDFEYLKLQIWGAIDNTFFTSSSSSSSSSSPEHLMVLRSAVVSIQQQEEQDRRWEQRLDERVPVWRPQKCLRTHNTLLQNMVDSRLMKAKEEESTGTDGLSSPLKKKVFGMGKRVKEDLLTVVRLVKDCYPPHMDIVNLYAGLYHHSFSAQLTELAASGLETDDCNYLLFWTNHCYPHEILNHEDVQGKIKVACLGSLLPQDRLNQLEDQYLIHKLDKVKLWLNKALEKEEQSWLSGTKPELNDKYCFSPLAVDVIQMIDSSLNELRCVIRDQTKAQRITAHLESFLSSYKTCVEEFVKRDHSNVDSVIKAHLFCEQQFRDYITSQTGSLSEQQRRSCLDTLSALWDCGYRCLTRPLFIQLKVCYSHLWTSDWLDGSFPVVDSLLDSLNQQLTDLADLKPACKQSLLRVLHEDVVLQYVKRMLKTRKKSKETQVGGAQRMIEDAKKINDFFSQRHCNESLWLGEMLCSLAEILRLQDPGSVQLEMVSLARRFPDLRDIHVSALLSLKTGLSAADVRSIRQSVGENREPNVSTNQSPLFFSKVKVKWINNKINQIGPKT